jgi:FkbM family methyltransferase
MKIIYDFGACVGGNIPYYLLKSDLVIAIEANPSLVERIKQKFEKEIIQKKLIVLNYLISNKIGENQEDFFVHKTNHYLSRTNPDENKINNFNKIKLKSKKAIDIIKEFGEPYYIKIDIEGQDHLILKDLFLSKIKPPYISAEAHKIEVFTILSALGEYESFKLVIGADVHKKYKDHKIKTKNDFLKYSFPLHSAGPFGNDIDGPWLTVNNLFKPLSYLETGWVDIHCSNIDEADPLYKPSAEVKVISENNKISGVKIIPKI